MRKLMWFCAWLCAMAFVVVAHPAQATGTNGLSYVSNTGSDSNSCANPTTGACLTITGALAKTANDGEIDCVNADLYSAGTVSITQSVTIDCAGGVGQIFAGIVVSGTGIVVRLRNLSINNNGLGAYGIDAQNMAALYVENCVITNSNNSMHTNAGTYLGIKFEPSAGPSQLFVSNSVISNNGNGGGITGGIYIVPNSGVQANVTIEGSKIEGNIFGVVADGTAGGTIRGVIKNSVVSGNTENGITALSSGSSVWLLTDETAAWGNAYGLAAGGSGAEILARNTSVFGNTTGLHSGNGGAIYSYGNNSVNGNTTNGAFTGTIGLQ